MIFTQPTHIKGFQICVSSSCVDSKNPPMPNQPSLVSFRYYSNFPPAFHTVAISELLRARVRLLCFLGRAACNFGNSSAGLELIRLH